MNVPENPDTTCHSASDFILGQFGLEDIRQDILFHKHGVKNNSSDEAVQSKAEPTHSKPQDAASPQEDGPAAATSETSESESGQAQTSEFSKLRDSMQADHPEDEHADVVGDDAPVGWDSQEEGDAAESALDEAEKALEVLGKADGKWKHKKSKHGKSDGKK